MNESLATTKMVEQNPVTGVCAFKKIEHSDWLCYLFGHHPEFGVCFRPKLGCEPNAWHRFWQRVVLGHVWVRLPLSQQFR